LRVFERVGPDHDLLPDLELALDFGVPADAQIVGVDPILRGDLRPRVARLDRVGQLLLRGRDVLGVNTT
jgi:hypothetical protein